MPRKNSIRLNAKLLLNFRNELSLEELQKIVGAATGWKSQFAIGVFVSGLCGRQVARTISVRDADYDQIRNATVLSQEVNRARRVIHVIITIGHVEHRIA